MIAVHAVVALGDHGVLAAPGLLEWVRVIPAALMTPVSYRIGSAVVVVVVLAPW